MKARLRRQLRCFKGQIERRLERENERNVHDGHPVLRGAGAAYGIASRVRAVAAGGIGLMHQMAEAIGLDREIDRRVELLRFHAPYEESDHVLNIAFNSLAGGECLEFLSDLETPAELPADVCAFQRQQHRWAKGSIETARKLLPRILGSALPRRVKSEAVFHLLGNIPSLLIIVLSV